MFFFRLALKINARGGRETEINHCALTMNSQLFLPLSQLVSGSIPFHLGDCVLVFCPVFNAKRPQLVMSESLCLLVCLFVCFAAKPPSVAAHNLPVRDPVRTGLEIPITEAIGQLVRRSSPVVTVVGGSACGKTSVAVEIGHRLAHDHGVKVVYMCVRGLTELHQVDKMIYHHMRHVFHPDSAASVTLVDLMKDVKKPLVFILDDVDACFEKVYRVRAYNGFCRLIQELTEANSNVRVITTSCSVIGGLQCAHFRVSCSDFSYQDAGDLLSELCPFVPPAQRAAIAYCSGRSPFAVRLMASVLTVYRTDVEELVTELGGKGCLPVGVAWSQCLRGCLEAVMVRVKPELVDAFLMLSIFQGSFDTDAASAILDMSEASLATVKLSILRPLVDRCLLHFNSQTQTYYMNAFVGSYARRRFAHEASVDEVNDVERRFVVNCTQMFFNMETLSLDGAESARKFHIFALENSLTWAQLGSFCGKMALDKGIAERILRLGTSSMLRVPTHLGSDLEIRVLHACKNALKFVEEESGKEQVLLRVQLAHCSSRRCCVGGIREALASNASSLEGIMDDAISGIRRHSRPPASTGDVAVSLLCDLLYLKSLVRVASEDLTGAEEVSRSLLKALSEQSPQPDAKGLSPVCHQLFTLWAHLILQDWQGVLQAVDKILELMVAPSRELSHFHRMALTQKFLTVICCALLKSSRSTNGKGQVKIATVVSLAKSVSEWNAYIQQGIAKRMKNESQSLQTARDVLAFQPMRKPFQDLNLPLLWGVVRSSLATDDIIETILSFIPSSDGTFLRIMTPSANQFCAMFVARNILPVTHPTVLFELATRAFSSVRWRIKDEDNEAMKKLESTIKEMTALEENVYACYALGLVSNCSSTPSSPSLSVSCSPYLPHHPPPLSLSLRLFHLHPYLSKLSKLVGSLFSQKARP